MGRTKEQAFYSYVANNRIDTVQRALRTGNLDQKLAQSGADLAVALGLLHMLRVLIVAGAKVQPEWVQLCPDKQKQALQQMIWDLEAGIRPEQLRVPRVHRGT